MHNKKEKIMIKTSEELNLKINGARLMTVEEFKEHEKAIPKVDVYWWLADTDPCDEESVAYVEGKYFEDEMYCYRDETNTWVRAVLDVDAEGLKVGDEFVFKGYVFTALSDKLAISNNLQGMAKYYDESLLDYIYSDDEVTCTINNVLANIFGF